MIILKENATITIGTLKNILSNLPDEAPLAFYAFINYNEYLQESYSPQLEIEDTGEEFILNCVFRL